MTNVVRSGRVSVLIAALLLVAGQAAAQTTALSFDSQPGDFVGAGQQHTYSTADASFTAAVSGNRVSLSMSPADGSFPWSLEFLAAAGAPLQVGSYRDARRSVLAAGNGLEVTGFNRGCNTLTGRFDVLEMVFGAGGTVERFAADFEQHCEQRAPALFGAIRFNSTVSQTVPFAGRYPAYALTVTPPLHGRVVGDRIDCGNGQGDCSLTFAAATPHLLKAVPDAGYQLLEWTGSCSGGEVVTIDVNTDSVCAAVFVPVPSSGPQTSLVLDSQTGDFIGQAMEARYASSARWTVSAVTPNWITLIVYGFDDSRTRLDFRAPNNGPLRTGIYPSAARAALSGAGAGLDVSRNGNGCSTIAAQFTVLEVEFGAGGEVLSFAADFEQHCEGHAAALLGRIRYHATIGSPLPYGGDYPRFRLTTLYSPHGRVTNGSLTCGQFSLRCSATLAAPASLTLTATPEIDYAFEQWKGDCSGTTPTTTVTVDATNKVCWAVFVPIPDTTPPLISNVPGNRRVVTPRASGAVVTWAAPSAYDVVDGTVAVTCDASSGSRFPVGRTVVTCRAADSSRNEAIVSFTIDVSWRQPGVDISGDGLSDLMWRHVGGQLASWQMSGTARIGVEDFGVLDPAWTLAAVGDLDGDGSADFIWQHVSGPVTVWRMQGATRIGTETLSVARTTRRIVASGDFDNDGDLDLIWQSPDGTVLVWLMDGVGFTGSLLLNGPTDWRIAAVGDIDGDGLSDLVWQGPQGQVIAWRMNGFTKVGAMTLFEGATTWRVAALTNSNGDDSPDIVWQDPASGAVIVWLMNGATRTGAAYLYDGPADWTVAGPK